MRPVKEEWRPLDEWQTIANLSIEHKSERNRMASVFDVAADGKTWNLIVRHLRDHCKALSLVHIHRRDARSLQFLCLFLANGRFSCFSFKRTERSSLVSSYNRKRIEHGSTRKKSEHREVWKKRMSKIIRDMNGILPLHGPQGTIRMCCISFFFLFRQISSAITCRLLVLRVCRLVRLSGLSITCRGDAAHVRTNTFKDDSHFLFEPPRE